MARKKIDANTPVETLKHKDKRTNIPIEELRGFVVDVDSLKGEVELTHINLNDKTVEGISHKKLPVFSVQYHPEASPGLHDSSYLFKRFVKMMSSV